MKTPYLPFGLVTLSLLALFAGSAHAENLASIKPQDTEPLSTHAKAACDKMSKAAFASNTKVLVIIFEGLGSFNAAASRASYQYREDLLAGKKVERPLAGGRSYLLNGLGFSLIKKHQGKFEILNFAYDAMNAGREALPLYCAERWKKARADGKAVPRKILIMGHSYGGHAAAILAKELEGVNVTVDALFSFDARKIFAMTHGEFARPKNVLRWENFFQAGFLGGDPKVDGAHRNFHSTGTIHGTVMARPEIMTFASQTIDKLNAQ